MQNWEKLGPSLERGRGHVRVHAFLASGPEKLWDALQETVLKSPGPVGPKQYGR